MFLEYSIILVGSLVKDMHRGRRKIAFSEEVLSSISFMVDCGGTNNDILDMLNTMTPTMNISMRTLQRVLSEYNIVRDSASRPSNNEAKRVSEACVKEIKRLVGENTSRQDVLEYVKKIHDETWCMKTLTKVMKKNNIAYTEEVDVNLLAVALALKGEEGREGLGIRHVQTEIRTEWGVNVTREAVRQQGVKL